MLKKSLCAAALLAAVGGCASPAGDRIAAWNPGQPVPRPQRAAATGEYALFTADTDYPLYSTRLDAGDAVGFQRLPDDRVVGFADGASYPIDGLFGTSFYWEYQGSE